MPFTDDGFDGRSYETVRDSLISQIENKNSDAEVTDGSFLETITDAYAAVLAQNQEQDLESLYEAGYLDTATGDDLDRLVELIGVSRTPAVKATGVVKFERDTNASQDYTISKGTVVQTTGNDPVQFVTTEAVTLSSGTKSVQANVRCTEGGTVGNVGANTIEATPSPVTGVETVTNPNPTGDTSYTDTDGDTLVVGTDEEEDDELRERAKESSTIGGVATSNSIGTALREIDGVKSVTIFENRTDTDNTGSGGLPPHSFEAVVYGGSDQDIADTLHSERALTARTYGGANGTQQSHTISSDNLSSDVTYYWSDPTKLDVDMTIDVVHNDNYVGKTDLRDLIVDYVGGTDTDGVSVTGTGLGEDVYLNRIEDIIVGEDDTGVIGVSSFSTTPSATTDSNGLSVVSVSSNEVAVTDGSDGSITINETQV